MGAIRNINWTQLMPAFIVCGFLGFEIFGFEVQDGMAATWKVGFYLVASLSAYPVLLFGLFALSANPIAGVLFTIGGMALLLYGLAGLYGAPLFKN